MTRKTKISVTVAALALVASYLFVSPWITIHQMRSAAEARDAEALSEHVDFPSLRQSLKDQMNVVVTKAMAKEQDSFAALGAMFAGAMIEKLVDAMITPAGLRQMMAGQEVSLSDSLQDAREPFADVSGSYESLNRFVVTVPGEEGEPSRFILRREGFGWKLTEIRVAMPELN